jgi:multicomponent K+:H+ antiporter subunit G
MTDLTGVSGTVVAILLLSAGVLSLLAALGLLRLREFFQRMHAPALTTTLATWCVSLASIISFSVLGADLDLRGLVIIVLLALTAPLTTTLLARATLFRKRSSTFLRQQKHSQSP